MRLTVVGCSGSFPGRDGSASCYLVEAEGYRVLLDLGSGALGQLATHADIHSIDAVLLSHLHPDHFIDLLPYFVARHYRPDRAAAGGGGVRLPVHGPADTPRRLERAYDLPEADGMHSEFDHRPWEPGTRQIGPFRVTVDRVDHPVETYAMRLEHGGRVLTYSGDTAPCDSLVALAREADVFLCEASFHEGRDTTPHLHMSGRQAAEQATRADVRKLLLTHVPPWNDPDRTLAEAAPAYAGPIELARPGAVLDP